MTVSLPRKVGTTFGDCPLPITGYWLPATDYRDASPPGEEWKQQAFTFQPFNLSTFQPFNFFIDKHIQFSLK
jgi:hypothetical protein